MEEKERKDLGNENEKRYIARMLLFPSFPQKLWKKWKKNKRIKKSVACLPFIYYLDKHAPG
jgi:hypothetical protein